jgi:hypothetical protein
MSSGTAPFAGAAAAGASPSVQVHSVNSFVNKLLNNLDRDRNESKKVHFILKKTKLKSVLKSSSSAYSLSSVVSFRVKYKSYLLRLQQAE